MNEWFLYLVIAWGGNDFRERALPMPDEETCVSHLVSARVEVNDGGENEHAVFAACAQGVARQRAQHSWGEKPIYEWRRVEEANNDD